MASQSDNESKPVTVRLPVALIARIDQAAHDRKITRSDRLLEVIERGLEAESIERLLQVATLKIEAISSASHMDKTNELLAIIYDKLSDLDSEMREKITAILHEVKWDSE